MSDKQGGNAGTRVIKTPAKRIFDLNTGLDPSTTILPFNHKMKGSVCITVSNGSQTRNYTVHPFIGQSKDDNKRKDQLCITECADIPVLLAHERNPYAGSQNRFIKEEITKQFVTSHPTEFKLMDGKICYNLAELGDRNTVLRSARKAAEVQHKLLNPPPEDEKKKKKWKRPDMDRTFFLDFLEDPHKGLEKSFIDALQDKEAIKALKLANPMPEYETMCGATGRKHQITFQIPDECVGLELDGTMLMDIIVDRLAGHKSKRFVAMPWAKKP